MFYALTLVGRMASAFYDISYAKVVGIMKKLLPRLEIDDTDQDFPKYFIQEFVRHMVQVQGDQGIPVTTFILFIDEAVKMEEHIRALYPVDSVGFTMTSIAARALLDVQIGEKTSPLNVALLISSLKVGLVELTDSGREVALFRLPSELDVKGVRDIWLRHYTATGVNPSSQTMHTMLLIAALLN
jgi:hypothetical protein